jgi:hypothetical protein
LLILYNANDAAALTLPVSNELKAQASSKDGARLLLLSSHLPQNENSFVLVTSQTRSVALQLVKESDILSIQPIDDTSGPKLLQKKPGEEVYQDSTLRFMPHALA